LDTVSDEQLLTWIKLVTDELVAIEKRFYILGGALCDNGEKLQEDLQALQTDPRTDYVL